VAFANAKQNQQQQQLACVWHGWCQSQKSGKKQTQKNLSNKPPQAMQQQQF